MSIFKSKPAPTLAQQSEELKVEEGDALALFETAAARLEAVAASQDVISQLADEEVVRLEDDYRARTDSLRQTSLTAGVRGRRAGQAATKLREFVGGEPA